MASITVQRSILTAAVALSLSACGGDALIRRHSGDIRRLADADGPVQAGKIRARFDRHLGRYATAESVVGLSTSALRNLFDAAFTTAFTGADPRHAQALGTVAAELGRRGLLEPSDVRDLQGIYVLVRDFANARRLKSEHPDFGLETIPAVTGEASGRMANLMELSPDGSELRIREFPQDAGPRIVIVSSLSCGPSYRALTDILGNPSVAAIFEEHAMWLMPPQAMLDVEKMTRWNAENPSFRFRHALSPAGWQGIDAWNETPILYFIRDGRQRAKVIGWPKGGRWDELKAGLRAIGLM